ncbi:MAG: phosphate transport system substrate-binding protein, partial [Pseudonocardiales bacterium]|nr:phosphate transport system substrate-binding protein [Pseudonocardiales bacterium]
MVTSVGRFRLTSAAALLAAGTLALAACGSSGGSTDNSTTTSLPAGGGSTTSSGGGSSPACSGGTLKAEGSTAQANAMTQWIKDYQSACSGATINYNPTGSGEGVASFTGDQVDFAGSDSALDPTAGEVAAAQKRCGST